jgi:hypothetical protein
MSNTTYIYLINKWSAITFGYKKGVTYLRYNGHILSSIKIVDLLH